MNITQELKIIDLYSRKALIEPTIENIIGIFQDSFYLLNHEIQYKIIYPIFWICIQTKNYSIVNYLIIRCKHFEEKWFKSLMGLCSHFDYGYS